MPAFAGKAMVEECVAARCTDKRASADPRHKKVDAASGDCVKACAM